MSRWACLTRRLMILLLVCAVARAEPPGTQVQIRDFHFLPAEISVAPGTRVTWTNEDDDAHTVVSETGLFRSAALDTHDSFQFTFDKPGVYHFSCSLHPKMVGTVVVR
jgi:plastocyanin